jgi:hypothetical protein
MAETINRAAEARSCTRGEVAVAVAAFAAGACLLWLSAPRAGEFWWSDSPRHALNGVFLKDLIAAAPWRNPGSWATQYYVQYPALTILFYPPLFYAATAPFYALFGVSHATALAVVLLHYVAAACGLYILARRWMSPPVALATGLLLMAAPGVALWGRQVMLEIPSLAFALWAVVVLRDFADHPRPARLYCGVFLLLCAAYTKITAIFVGPAVGLMLLAREGQNVRRDRHLRTAASLFAIGLIPLVMLTATFGRANLQSAIAIPDEQVSRAHLAGWVWYARQLPDQLGWPVLIAALLYPPLAVFGRRVRNVSRLDAVLLVTWFAGGYFLFSAIDLKEARHSTLILPPLLIAAGLAIEQMLPRRAVAAAALVLVAATACITWRYAPVPAVAGYREAADVIAHQAPANSVILFSGERDGSFIFNLRALDPDRHLFTVRSDKLLLRVAIRRELGVEQKAYSEAQISQMLDMYGISYVVAQSDFWTDLSVMASLQHVLRSDQFSEVARIPIVATVSTDDRELRIYRNNHPIEPGHTLTLDLPIIGATVEGSVGTQR